MKFFESFSRKSLGENVYKYILGGHIVKFDFTMFNLFAYKVVPYIDVLGLRVRYWVIHKCNAP